MESNNKESKDKMPDALSKLIDKKKKINELIFNNNKEELLRKGINISVQR